MAGASETRSGSPQGDAPADASDASGQPALKKRRTGGGTSTSSRGVANLTPEQLARKRHNDREAQRAIRERTKNQIDTLNQRIRELEGQQPYQHLQAVLRQKDAVAAENADIRKRLESVVAVIQPILHASSGLNELAAAAERSPLVPHPVDPRAFNSTLAEIAAASPNGVESPGGADTSRPWGFPGNAPTSHVRQYATENAFDERMGVDFLLENNGQQRAVDPQLVSPVRYNVLCANGIGQHAPLLEPFSTLPRICPPTCPLDALALDFMADRRTRAAAGATSKELVGPAYPNFTAVVYPDRIVEAHPLSNLFTDIVRTFPDISGLPEKVAIIYSMFLVTRWLVEPTQENYERMPEWMMPQPTQLFVPHPFWTEYIPWPRMRSHFAAVHNRVPFDTFFIPYTTTISVNWPYSPRDVLIPASKVHPSSLSAPSVSSMPTSPYSTSPATPQSQPHSSHEDEQWVMNPAFEAHVRNIANWSLGTAFQAAFPNSVEGVSIKENDNR